MRDVGQYPHSWSSRVPLQHVSRNVLILHRLTLITKSAIPSRASGLDGCWHVAIITLSEHILSKMQQNLYNFVVSACFILPGATTEGGGGGDWQFIYAYIAWLIEKAVINVNN